MMEGTWRKTSEKINGRCPFKEDTVLLNYDEDSEEEWEQDDGEDLGEELLSENEDEDEEMEEEEEVSFPFRFYD
jgi:hypothetical protein